MRKAVSCTEAEEARLIATAKKVRNDVSETERESNPQLWVKAETQIISCFNFQGFKISMDGCVCTHFYEYLSQIGKLCSFILELTLLYLVEITVWLSSSDCMKACFLQRVFTE